MTVRTSFRVLLWLAVLIPAATAVLVASQPVIAAFEASPAGGTAAPLTGMVGPASTPVGVVHATAHMLYLPDALTYNDCSGTNPLAATSIYRDVCLPGVYLVGHNPGAFASILSLRAGSLVSYHGRTYDITSVTLVDPATEWIDAQVHPAALTLQTCANDAQSRIWVFRASATSATDS